MLLDGNRRAQIQRPMATLGPGQRMSDLEYTYSEDSVMTEALAIRASADAAAAGPVTDFVIFVGKHSDSVDVGGTNAAKHSQQHSMHHVDAAVCQLSDSSQKLGPC